MPDPPCRTTAAARRDGQALGSCGNLRIKMLQPFAAGLSGQTSNGKRAGQGTACRADAVGFFFLGGGGVRVFVACGSVMGRAPSPSPRAGVPVGHPGLMHPWAGNKEKTKKTQNPSISALNLQQLHAWQRQRGSDTARLPAAGL